MVDVRPKLFEDIENAVKTNLRYPLLSGFGPCAFLARVIQIGNHRSGAIACNFREIEAPAAGIRPGY